MRTQLYKSVSFHMSKHPPPTHTQDKIEKHRKKVKCIYNAEEDILVTRILQYTQHTISLIMASMTKD
jgi:hypothetical protein